MTKANEAEEAKEKNKKKIKKKRDGGRKGETFFLVQWGDTTKCS